MSKKKKVAAPKPKFAVKLKDGELSRDKQQNVKGGFYALPEVDDEVLVVFAKPKKR